MKLNIAASRHSAFYSPLIASITAGFLEREGIDASYRVLAAGERSQDLIREGVADIIQSAVSSNWKPMEAGDTPLPVHFAQINQRDGFFLAARRREADFRWKNLKAVPCWPIMPDNLWPCCGMPYTTMALTTPGFAYWIMDHRAR